LIAQRGHAFIFIDGSLPDDELRFTLAHETAHFVHHYEGPRSSALEVLGSGIEVVLDGERPPTAQERLRGALRGVPIGVYQHMMDRADGLPDRATSQLEAEADLIAFELLAPTNTVLRTTTPGDNCSAELQTRYGLPSWAADRWRDWIDSRRRGDSFIRRLEAERQKTG
jgi:Zn-dependent peptidase ImmA (M78 family)